MMSAQIRSVVRKVSEEPPLSSQEPEPDERIPFTPRIELLGQLPAIAGPFVVDWQLPDKDDKKKAT